MENTPCDSTIVSAAIYPPIGVMRVGNSPSEYFIGPEVSEPLPQSPSFYRDSTGALKRQAARFRIYGLNANGEVVKELTANNANITWHAQLANQKASWYKFEIALDIPEAADAKPSILRNAKVEGEKRRGLLIDGAKHTISGCNTPGNDTQFVGQFNEVKVYLGEMTTDSQGRLVMLGGHGKSANPLGHQAITFGNNEGWYDDTSDGPINADVVYDGVSLSVKPGWVVCAPPDYAPMQKSVRTMWDLMRDIAVGAHMLPVPGKPSFTHDILPIFQRMTDLQWVNAGFAAGFGWQSPFDFTSELWLTRLSDPSATWQESRRTLFNNFRNLDTQFDIGENPMSVTAWDPTNASLSPQQWPWIYGDAMSIDANESPRQFLTLTRLQLNALSQWVDGEFIADYDPARTAPTAIDDVPVTEQPDMLTKAAMDFCLADAFHPGCEMTWPMRSVGMYSEAFRLRHAEDTSPTHDVNFGPVLTPHTALSFDGPINNGQIAGGITRWMAIPWQTDTASCRDGYNTALDPYLPTFWPARVPNNMLNQENYNKVINESLPIDERQAAFNEREFWLDDLPIGPTTDYTAQINDMIDNFDKLAVVLPKTEKGVSGFPSTMQVGLTPDSNAPVSALKSTVQHKAKKGIRPDLSLTEKAHRFIKKS
ncbi:LodA/GoxA family CTQ-dependent oxidase [Pseudoalteromonas sp. MMG013]|uniref:LodA/GoxA family CTQ-dependent oxidase n=1 Tax=Pseudoalteromonas sp. MMG013 TaxID=2822687 RepID=UPI001B391A6B|nr:LodA/GoxA family CTQ-dependent oxidase [Pseudoalteromonas sp. MMG013]MBQ4860707.1 LodA/GoxA family CTQ-dependent oxidase [Pseudoalteromonas sp. MMG013]